MKKINSLAAIHIAEPIGSRFITKASRGEMKEIRQNANEVNKKLKYKFDKTLKDFDWDFNKFLAAFMEFANNIPSNG